MGLLILWVCSLEGGHSIGINLALREGNADVVFIERRPDGLTQIAAHSEGF